MSLTDAAAWWGAAVATAVLLWDIVKYSRGGARIRVRANPNMRIIDHPDLDPKHDFIHVEAVNIGDKKTTITHLVSFHYDTVWGLVRSKPSRQGIVANPAMKPLPYLLEPGERWAGLIDQGDLQSDMGSAGYFYCGVIHASRSRPVVARVSLKR